MARVPVIDSPCPIAGKQVPAGANEHCTRCDRSVHNLDRMSERERVDFMGACSGKVCVAYTVRLPIRRCGLAAATLAAAALATLPVAAQTPEPSPGGAQSPLPGASAKLPNCDDLDFIEISEIGGVTQGDQAEWTNDGKDAPPDLPTIEDDGR